MGLSCSILLETDTEVLVCVLESNVSFHSSHNNSCLRNVCGERISVLKELREKTTDNSRNVVLIGGFIGSCTCISCL